MNCFNSSNKKIVITDESSLNTPMIEDSLKTSTLTAPLLSTTPKIEDDAQTYFLAVIENNCFEVGVALLGINPPIMTLYQFQDSSLYSNVQRILEMYHPCKIIISSPYIKSPLSIMLVNSNSKNIIIEISRSFFNDDQGIKLIHQYSHTPNDVLGSQYVRTSRYLSLSAVAAVLHYAQTDASFYIHDKVLETTFKQLDGYLMVDPLVLINYSILSPPIKNTLMRITTTKRKNQHPSLFALVDRTFTQSGLRQLRSSLVTPLSDEVLINLRLGFVEELVKNEDLCKEISDILMSFEDIDLIITYLVSKQSVTKISSNKSLPIEYLIKLGKVIQNIMTFIRVIGKTKSGFSSLLIKNLEFAQINELSSFLNSFIDVNCSKDIYIIKSKIIPVLDLSRSNYESILSKINGIHSNIMDKYNIKCALKYNKTRKFFIQVKKQELVNFESSIDNVHQTMSNFEEPVEKITTPSGYKVPPEFLFVVEGKDIISATTQNLMLLNKRLEETENDIINISHKYCEEKMDDLRKYISSIYKISETIGLVDMLLSFAITSREYDYVKPIINSEKLELNNVRHPIMENLIKTNESYSNILMNKSQSYMPNSIKMSSLNNIVILNGINMSGKSTMIQTVALVIILAQIGCFVPATSATIPLFNSLYSRCSNSDNIEGSASSFAVEMREMSHIITQASMKSFVFIDEPCSSTAVLDGVALSWACIEKLVEKKCYAIISTHYSELNQLSNIYPCIKSLHMKSSITDNGFNYYYQVSEEICDIKEYGIITASQFLPEELIKYSREAYKIITSKKKKPKTGNSAIFALIEKLLIAKDSNMNDDALKLYLNNIKSKCTVKK